MYSLDDTIAAISTPLGEGGIGIVRLSGPDSVAILKEIFRRAKGEGLESYRLHYGHIIDPDTEEKVDEVLVSYMKAPHSYTRQDVVEINCHGGIVPLRRVLELVLRYGARLAHPGEMTSRAFLLGRIDLAQAEAVLDIVRAKTEAGLRAAVSQLGGWLSQEIRRVRAELVEVLAYLEATIDFEEDEIPERDISEPLKRAQEKIEALLASAHQGIIYRQGVRVAIVGRPNVGKSSLLNALLKTSRAIVAPIPGTTRDTVEESCNLQGVPISLIDTAGIAEGKDLVERLGVERSREALQRADLTLMVVDGSEPLQEEDQEIASLLNEKPSLLVINKNDLPQLASIDGLLPQVLYLSVSALTGEGLGELEEAILDTIFSGRVVASDAPLVTNPRHKQALQSALEHLLNVEGARKEALPADFLAIDLHGAVNALGEITGETATEDLLQLIFSEFCIGK